MQSIRILKSDLKNHPQLDQQLRELCESVRESDDAFIYFPFAWKLMSFMTILSRSGLKSESINKSKDKSRLF